MSHTHVIEIYNLNVSTGVFTRIDVIDFSFKNLQYFNRLNGVGACSFDLAVQNAKATTSNLKRFSNFIVIKRDTFPVWTGFITDVIGKYDNVVGDLTVQCNSLLYALKDRYSGQVDNYASQDLSTIAWAQINQTQSRTNGTLGITQGTLQTSQSLPDTMQYKTVYDTLVQYASYANGFDFDFTPTFSASNLLTGFRFNTYNPRLGSIRTDLPDLVLGQNVLKFDFRTNKPILNSGIATGGGTGTGILSTTLDYQSSELAYTRRETIQPYKDENNASVLSARLNTFLNQVSVENYVANIELEPDKRPFLTDINLGDVLQLNIQVPNSSYMNFSNQVYVTDITVQIDNEGREHIIPKVILIN